MLWTERPRCFAFALEPIKWAPRDLVCALEPIEGAPRNLDCALASIRPPPSFWGPLAVKNNCLYNCLAQLGDPLIMAVCCLGYGPQEHDCLLELVENPLILVLELVENPLILDPNAVHLVIQVA